MASGTWPDEPQHSPGKAKVRPTRAADVLVLAALPSLVCSLLVSMFTFAYQELAPLVWAVVAASCCFALIFLAIGCGQGRGAQITLGILVLIAVAVGVQVGLAVDSRYMAEFWRMDTGATYEQVAPWDPAASHSDAAVLVFKPGVRVDTQHAVGYLRDGAVHCVAPISSGDSASAAQYWAAGLGCCDWRGSFSCGDLGDPSARSGVALRDGGEFWEAARMATSVHRLPRLQGRPIFVRWTGDAAGYKESLRSRAVTCITMACGVHWAVVGGLGVLLSRAL